MPNLVPWLLFAHAIVAIVAFGPTYVYPLIGSMGAKEPQHSLFGLKLSAAISDRVVIPLAVVQGITGVLLVIGRPWNLADPSGRWLISGIVLYVIAFGFATGVQRKRVRTLVAMLESRPADAPAGPPPAPALALVGSIRQGGNILSVLITLIVLLMMLKPTL